jgi:hypothetical protein
MGGLDGGTNHVKVEIVGEHQHRPSNEHVVDDIGRERGEIGIAEAFVPNKRVVEKCVELDLSEKERRVGTPADLKPGLDSAVERASRSSMSQPIDVPTVGHPVTGRRSADLARGGRVGL